MTVNQSASGIKSGNENNARWGAEHCTRGGLTKYATQAAEIKRQRLHSQHRAKSDLSSMQPQPYTERQHETQEIAHLGALLQCLHLGEGELLEKGLKARVV